MDVAESVNHSRKRSLSWPQNCYMFGPCASTQIPATQQASTSVLGHENELLRPRRLSVTEAARTLRTPSQTAEAGTRASRQQAADVDETKHSLLNLPLEIRLRIYSFVFGSTKIHISKHRHVTFDHWVQIGDPPHKYHTYRIFSRAISLLQTSKQIYHEAAPLFFSEGIFDIVSQRRPQRLVGPADIPQHILIKIRRVVVSTFQAFDWIDRKNRSKRKLEPQNSDQRVLPLQEVTLVDSSYLIFWLKFAMNDKAQSTFDDVALFAGNHTLDNSHLQTIDQAQQRLLHLRRVVHQLWAHGTSTITIQSSNKGFSQRQVVLELNEDRERRLIVTVHDMSTYTWRQNAERILRGVLQLDQSTEFRFVE